MPASCRLDLKSNIFEEFFRLASKPTDHRRRANSNASALPIPLDAPVTSTTFVDESETCISTQFLDILSERYERFPQVFLFDQ